MRRGGGESELDEEGGGPPEGGYATRAGLKLEAALRGFCLDVRGLFCADFGCHAGGFTDCLLAHGAARVYALDTAHGVLDYRLRRDPRVVVMERTNALHAAPPGRPVDLVTIDLGWTRQRLAIPAALRWLGPGGQIVSLLKPHYELDDDEKEMRLVEGVLDHAAAEAVCARVLAGFPALGATVVAAMRSPLGGAKSARRSRGEGNREYLVLAHKTPGTGPAERRADGPPRV